MDSTSSLESTSSSSRSAPRSCASAFARSVFSGTSPTSTALRWTQCLNVLTMVSCLSASRLACASWSESETMARNIWSRLKFMAKIKTTKKNGPKVRFDARSESKSNLLSMNKKSVKNDCSNVRKSVTSTPNATKAAVQKPMRIMSMMITKPIVFRAASDMASLIMFMAGTNDVYLKILKKRMNELTAMMLSSRVL
eukprot:Amastigsp_a677871_58.p3 type:complete len:196 gc:universal Amastigsp_a677871_58:500-1087(+)